MKMSLRILVAHNSYQWHGGEDAVVQAEVALLRQYGHEVHVYRRHNEEIGGIFNLCLAAQALWSNRTTKDIGQLLPAFRPDVIHVHNTFPLISPSLLWSAGATPVVQTLHNFRLLCPQAMFLRDGKICEACLARSPWRSVVHGCYRGSTVQSGVVTGMLMLHARLGTYRNKVARYIALNGFCRDKFIEGGLPAERIAIKPNFVNVDAAPSALPRSGGLFVGRISSEKGIEVLLAALYRLPGKRIRVIGDGPRMACLQAQPGVLVLGAMSREDVLAEMRRAAFLVMPSIWYETFGLVLIEAFACGLPVIASRLGAMQELVQEGYNGLLFDPGSDGDLARVIAWAETHPDEMQHMGRNARDTYIEKFTPEKNHQMLLAIYREAIQGASGGRDFALTNESTASKATPRALHVHSDNDE